MDEIEFDEASDISDEELSDTELEYMDVDCSDASKNKNAVAGFSSLIAKAAKGYEQTSQNLSLSDSKDDYDDISPNHFSWDPHNPTDWMREPVSPLCVGRLKRDFTALYAENVQCINATPEENDITKIHAVISGPANTPYEGGFFYFFVRAPPSYPIKPPKVKLMTTGSGNVRFNPNFYKNGKVCLSILGTWSGPPWSAAQSLLSLFLSIQSLMNEKPYHNEPGYAKERHAGDSDRYNKIILHETLRVAVCEMIEGDVHNAHRVPASLKELIEEKFVSYYKHYQDEIAKYQHLDGQQFEDPHYCNKGTFSFKIIGKRLEEIFERLSKKNSEE